MEYSEPRATKDLDILIGCSKINAKRITAALKEFGGSLTGINEKFFATKGRFYKIGRPPNRIDIITSAKGASYAEIKKKKVQKLINGVKVFFISRTHLMNLKKAANRPQDQVDILNLKKYAEIDLA